VLTRCARVCLPRRVVRLPAVGVFSPAKARGSCCPGGHLTGHGAGDVAAAGDPLAGRAGRPGGERRGGRARGGGVRRRVRHTA
jgi:hypothetical protein